MAPIVNFWRSNGNKLILISHLSSAPQRNLTSKEIESKLIIHRLPLNFHVKHDSSSQSDGVGFKKLSNKINATFRLTSNWKTWRNNFLPIRNKLVMNTAAASTSKAIEFKRPLTMVTAGSSRAALESRANYLLNSVAVSATSNMSTHIQIKELCKFLKQFPQAQGFIEKTGVQQLLLLKNRMRDPVVLEDIEEGLALLGFYRPPIGWGIRILSIDGGGLRGVMALEILRELEELTGKQIHQLFDFICGVSTGSVLAILLGSLKCSVSTCEQLYKQIGTEIFQQNPIWGTGKLVLSHAFYDTDHWTKMLRQHLGHVKLIEISRDPSCPKLAAVSTLVSGPRLEPFLFRSYDYPTRIISDYRGSNQAELWEAARASAAAPGYFEEFKYGNDIHQDGGILVNNPTALAIHEAKLLWPNEVLQCVISVGNGRYEPLQPTVPQKPNYTGLKNKLMKIIDSATDTEAVHTVLHDLLHPSVYYRFNPYLTENISLDETRPDKLQQLKNDACMYSRRNKNKLILAASKLTESRSSTQHIKDFLSLKKLTYFG